MSSWTMQSHTYYDMTSRSPLPIHSVLEVVNQAFRCPVCGGYDRCIDLGSGWFVCSVDSDLFLRIRRSLVREPEAVGLGPYLLVCIREKIWS